MSVNKEYHLAEGAYGIPRIGNESVIIKVPSEDPGKKEGALDWSELLPVTANMFGIVTGGVENESYQETLARELQEEQGLVKIPEVFQNGLPSVSIKQERPGKKVLFTVHGHQFPVTEADISYLKEKTEFRRVEDTQLANFLQDNKDILRPSAYVIFTLFLQYLERKS